MKKDPLHSRRSIESYPSIKKDEISKESQNDTKEGICNPINETREMLNHLYPNLKPQTVHLDPNLKPQAIHLDPLIPIVKDNTQQNQITQESLSKSPNGSTVQNKLKPGQNSRRSSVY